MTFDLDGPLRDLMQQRLAQTKWDPTTLHVSDLSVCPRSVWARRNGKTSRPITLESFLLREMGKRYEHTLCRAFEAAGIAYEYQKYFEVTLFGVDISGTATFVLPEHNAVLDVHGTSFPSSWVGRGADKHKSVRIPTTPRFGYRVTSAAYALALGMEHYGVHTYCRSTGLHATSWYAATDIVTEVGRALAERAETAPGTPEDTSALPPVYTYSHDGISRQCQGCFYYACENNTNTEKETP